MLHIARVMIAVFVLGLACAAGADMHWGEFTPNDCVAGMGTREWSAILWDIPQGESWEAACAATAAAVNGNPARRPNRCVVGLNVWGVWEVPDERCGPPPPTIYEFVVYPPRRLRPVRIEAVVERNRGGTFEAVARSRVADVLSGRPVAYRWRTALPHPSTPGRVTIRVWVRRPDGTETSAGQATHDLGSAYEAADRALTLAFTIRELNDGLYEVKPRFRIDPE
jgi:hypothetical protein